MAMTQENHEKLINLGRQFARKQAYEYGLAFLKREHRRIGKAILRGEQFNIEEENQRIDDAVLELEKMEYRRLTE